MLGIIKLSCYLLHIGFICTTADSSLIIYAKDIAIIYFLVYVNDILITGSDSILLDSIIAKLQLAFAMKKLGQLHYFLGVEVYFHEGSVFLSRAKYIGDLLTRASMLEGKPLDTYIS